MSIVVKLTSQKQEDKNVFSAAFHADVQSEAQAAAKLAGHAPGTYLTFSTQKQNFCAAVSHDGEIIVNPFRWEASGFWFNGTGGPFANELDLLDHLVKGQIAVALYQE
ncbi:MAG: hypothetical protein FJZ58_06265 [Chlamydiae bacterium]|nr:hypothetical protein [Chlamydiota bacterium]